MCWIITRDGTGIRSLSKLRKRRRRSCLLEDLTVAMDNRVRIKNEKQKKKYMDLVIELIAVIIGSLGTLTKGM